MKIICIIVTYNGMRWIDKCINSILSSTIPLDIFVVDNCSTDGTIDYLDSISSSIILNKQEVNLGFGQANNLGIRYAIENNYDYVLLLNQDAYLKKDTIEKLLPHIGKNCIYSPIHINGKESRIDKNFKKITIDSNASIVDDLVLGIDNSPYEVLGVNAACWFSSVEVYRSIGGFNPLFHHYGEDSNYICRMHYHKYGFYIVLHSYVIHDRNNYGNEGIYKKDQLTRSFLRVATDINSSFFVRFKGYLLVFLSQIVHIGLMATFFQLPSAIWCIAYKHNKIRASRRREKELGQNWL